MAGSFACLFGEHRGVCAGAKPPAKPNTINAIRTFKSKPRTAKLTAWLWSNNLFDSAGELMRRRRAIDPHDQDN